LQIQRSAPVERERVEFQIEPPRVVHKTFAKFAVAQNQSAALEQRQLSGDGVVGQSAGADEQFDVSGTDEFAQNLFGGLKIFFETFATMRFRRLLERAAHLA